MAGPTLTGPSREGKIKTERIGVAFANSDGKCMQILNLWLYDSIVSLNLQKKSPHFGKMAGTWQEIRPACRKRS